MASAFLNWAFKDAARCAEFRIELETLQGVPRNYTRALADLAKVEDLTALEKTQQNKPTV